MRINELYDKFCRKESGTVSSLKCWGDRLISYNTCIAQWMSNTESPVVLLNASSYSRISDKHQDKLREVIKSKYSNIKIIWTNVPVPQGSITLIKYLK